MQRNRIVAATLGVALLATACGGNEEDPSTAEEGSTDAASEGGELTDVTFVEGLSVFPYEVVTVAIEEGFLEDEGISAEVVETENELQAVAAGSAQFAIGGSMAIPTAQQEGIDAMTIFATMNGLGMNVAYSNELAEEAGISPDSPVEDRLLALEGQTIGLTGPLGDDEVFFRYFLNYVGLDPDSDVEFVYIGGTPDRIAAMGEGRIQAYMSSIPAAELAEHEGVGVRMIVPSAEDVGLDEVPYTGVHTTATYAEENPEVVGSVGRALSNAANFMREEQEATTQIIKDAYPEIDESVVEAGMQAIYPAVPENGRMTEEGWASLLEAGTAAGVLEGETDPSEGVYWTNEYLLE